MIDMITIALDVGIMTGIVLFVAFGLTLRRDGLHRGIGFNRALPGPWGGHPSGSLPSTPPRIIIFKGPA